MNLTLKYQDSIEAQMDAVVKHIGAAKPDIGSGPAIEKPTEEEALAAVRTLIAWAGDENRSWLVMAAASRGAQY